MEQVQWLQLKKKFGGGSTEVIVVDLTVIFRSIPM